MTPYDPRTQSMFAQLRAAFMAAGRRRRHGDSRAYAALFGMVQRQASMVSFVGIFQLLGDLFIALDAARAPDEAAEAAPGSRARALGNDPRASRAVPRGGQ